MARVEKSIEVDRPVRTVYDQWTQFEEFPRFMEGVEAVHQLDERTLHWVAKIGGKREEWEAEIVQQMPDQQIAWRHTRGAVNRGVVTFTPVDDGRCRVTLALEYDPQGFVEKVGDVLGVVSRRVEGDLERFKRYVEERGVESGGWRGEIRPREPHHDPMR
ncbi:SRPBCC family protein [Anaeromyxobacter sp. PSR-1]|uniref:SRPBCC family protein n=1 Tax=Anaeromyxobacter sp. PSR-1 TaxID=1300915 RepID=UPI0005DE910B|nr:SRPBCC family protein [Anaeromyxobacter sp. PSR-1]GAO05485.1 putative 17.2 kDa protein in melC2-rnhH intergenic region [Anaeromyxobacter sp. PSR-1]